MIINAWLVLTPGGDRPYLSTNAPVSLAPKEGQRVFRVELDVPEPTAIDGVISAKLMENKT